MLENYFKIAWRNLFRSKSFSITNLLGLTIGMTCTILILLWVQHELSFDTFHRNYKNTYQVFANRDFNGEIFTDNAIVFPLAKAMETNYPQVKNAVVTSYSQPHILTVGDNKLKKNGYNVSEHYFNIFSWKFLKGNAATALTNPNSIVLTQSTADAFFGKADPVGKVLRLDNSEDVKVSAVIADVPSNSTLQFDFIMPYNYSEDNVKQAMTDWQNSFSNVFIQAVPGADANQLAKEINTVFKQHNPGDKISIHFVHPMRKWRLYSDFKEGKNSGMIEYVRLFTIIAIIILLIACVNFMNLSTARSEKRSKEVGIRKTLGSGKRQLVAQFFFESLILAFISFIFAILFVYLLLPSFNLLVDKKLALDFTDPWVLAGAFAIIVFTGLVAGSYPALYLSSFNPVQVLKGTYLAGKKALVPRKILVVSQFIISILFISATIIVYQQLVHIKNRDIGYNPNNLIMLPSSPETNKSFAVIKEELLKTRLINAVTRTTSPITAIWNYTPAPDWEGKPANTHMIVSAMGTDADFTKTMGIKLVAGKDFSGSVADSLSMLLNAAAVKTMGLKDPIGMQMKYLNKTYTVIGITENVVMSSPFKPVDPMMILYRPNNSGFISVRLHDGVKPQEALHALQPIFKKFNPAYPFEYQFADQEFGKKFANEELIGKLTNIFAGLAIFICCIGLAGLASFTIEKRIREIGIRKVLGANIRQLLMLISKDFLILVFIAFVIAVPLTWWLMSNWLEKYVYHINISAWLFIGVGAVILLLTLLVVSLNTIKAALANPVKNLRTE